MFGARTDDWAWVRAPIPELYDLRADPAETRNLAKEPPADAPDLDADVERVLSRAHEASARSALTAEQVDALRSLGYAYSATPPEASGADPKERLSVLNRFNEVRRIFVAGRCAEAAAQLKDLLRDDLRACPDSRCSA